MTAFLTPVEQISSASSRSLPSREDITGPTKAYTSRPASHNVRMASKRLPGSGAPGSVRLETESSGVVTVIPMV